MLDEQRFQLDTFVSLCQGFSQVFSHNGSSSSIIMPYFTHSNSD
ncbi:hypothetical protein KDH_09840 [Dictyobacter sp. S3.2.2.5]|uniref:Uncharacterized protein n=1 Tax=Dictyobacter halimunensis TaxID=3026934 RepID=A0ABQ6FKH4_9CHLR|nr:hypothetical protein KDH_09840 [Dictyobacter sp. S3.2.2.5]